MMMIKRYPRCGSDATWCLRHAVRASAATCCQRSGRVRGHGQAPAAIPQEPFSVAATLALCCNPRLLLQPSPYAATLAFCCNLCLLMQPSPFTATLAFCYESRWPNNCAADDDEKDDGADGHTSHKSQNAPPLRS
jgi:hypothetical protein